MSTASRLISGSTAHWIQIGITILSQVAFVPIYLTHWNVSIYGVWLAIQALISIIVRVDLGFHEFLSYEFLRYGKDRCKLGEYLWSGIGISIIINLFHFIIILLISTLGILGFFLGKLNITDPHLLQSAVYVLFLQAAIWFIFNCIPGLIFKALAPLGYYPRMAWWNLLFVSISNLSPALAVLMGADFLMAGIIAAIASYIITIPLYFDLFRLLKKEKIIFSGFLWQFGYKQFIYSLSLSAKLLFENLRQEGVRILISPLVGPAGLASFSTMRTGSNMASQGLNTITYPLMPELMRFIHNRDQVRSETVFGTIWFVLVTFMAPAIVLLQIFIQPLYQVWTQGKVQFNPVLFAAFSITVLIYAVAQPSIAVVKGNNLLKTQLNISLMACLIAIIGIFTLVPLIGIAGSGIALIFAEISATIGYQIAAKKWLQNNGLTWPENAFKIAASSIYIAFASILGIIYLSKIIWLIVIISLIFFCINISKFWKALPNLATENARKFANYFSPVKLNIIKKS